MLQHDRHKELKETRIFLGLDGKFSKVNTLNELNQTQNWKLARFAARYYPTGIYLLKFNDKSFRARYKICSKLTVKTPERCQ